jgi:lysozyme family protein
MSNEIFEEAFEETMEFEGGYINDLDDPGGETKYGISKRSYPQLDIKNLTLEEAKEILYRDFWMKGPCEWVGDIDHYFGPMIAEKLFDMSVNLGVHTAAKLLQRAVRASDEGEDLVEDGIIGPITIAAVKKAVLYDGAGLLGALKSEMAGYYRSLPAKLKEKYLVGWLNRAYS